MANVAQKQKIKNKIKLWKLKDYFIFNSIYIWKSCSYYEVLCVYITVSVVCAVGVVYGYLWLCMCIRRPNIILTRLTSQHVLGVFWSLSPQQWGYKQVQPCPVFYVDVGDLNPGCHAYTASAFSSWAISPAWVHRNAEHCWATLRFVARDSIKESHRCEHSGMI